MVSSFARHGPRCPCGGRRSVVAFVLPSGPDDGHRGRLIAGHQRREAASHLPWWPSASGGASREVMAIGHLPTVSAIAMATLAAEAAHGRR
jgi:hypothetical protein